MTALSNNLNELDLLLQDLSAARKSTGQVERQEIITETRTFTSQAKFQDVSESLVPPQPPQRSKSAGLGTFLDGSEAHNGLHAVERSRTEQSVSRITGNEESKWEYMGFGIWENREGSTSPSGFYPNEEPNMGYPEGNNPTYQRPKSPTYQDRRTSGHMNRSSGYQVETVRASNATHVVELDNLMTSLHDFKLGDRQVDEPVIPPNLDTMLGNLQEDMGKQGVKTTQKGVCEACNKPIVGQVITALGYTWHPEHFTCSFCNQELGTSNFFERDGKPYCEKDYHHLFSPRCGYCSGPILDKCISALENTWHPEHFLCSGCGRQLGEDGFHERGDSAYCKTCYFDEFAPKCGGCNSPITDNYISSLNQQWHQNCFVCKECNTPFHDGDFFEHEGHPYCETHYHALRGSLCAGCHKAISGRCITAMFRKFHPEHFVCSFCLKQLNKGTFKEQADKPYCHECFDRLFG